MKSSCVCLMLWCALWCLCTPAARAEDVTDQAYPFMTLSQTLNDTGYFPCQAPGTGSDMEPDNGTTDRNSNTYNTTWTGLDNSSWPYDGIGLKFAQGISGTYRFEWEMQTFVDGGWYDTLDMPIRVQVTTDPAFAEYAIITRTYHENDGLWKTVPSYNDYPLLVSASVLGPDVPPGGATFVFEFDFQDTIYGIRIIGDGGGKAGLDESGFVGAQEVRLFSGSSSGRARPVSPAQDAEDVAIDDVELVWIPAVDRTSSATACTRADPNLLLASGPDPLPLQTTSFAPTLAKDTLYFWRVDEVRDDGTIVTGYTASFRTELSLPIITSHPQDIAVGAGRNAVFYVTATEPTGLPLTYQWYYDPNGIFERAVALVDGPDYSGATTPELTVIDVQSDDEGCYLCVVDNGNAVVTRAARLVQGHVVAHWPFDGTPDDVVNGYDGTEQGGPKYETGVIGQAMRFDGVDDYIALPPGFESFPWGLTLSVWARPTTNGNWARFVDFANGPSSDNILFSRAGTSTSFALGVYSGAAALDAWSPAVLENNVWQMLTATLDHHGNVVFYKNGRAIGTGRTNKPNAILRANNYIAKSNWADDLPYAGSMDDLWLFDYPLTPQEVADLYLLRPDIDEMCIAPPQFDVDGDCRITLTELAALAAAWLDCGLYPTCITEF